MDLGCSNYLSARTLKTVIGVLSSALLASPAFAQLNNTDGTSPSRDPLPEVPPLPEEPAPDDLLNPVQPPTQPDPTLPPGGEDVTITIQRFIVEDSTVFSEAELAEVTAPFTNRPITFDEVLAARDAVSQLYTNNGFITSGALLPPQSFQDGVATLRAVEGSVEDIVVEGTARLLPGYISSRLALDTGAPLQVDRLLQRLNLLRLDPLIENISADLQAGTQPGSNLLVISVIEANSFNVGYTLDNSRSPSVGSIRHQVQINERNLTGVGDRLTVGYTKTSGSGALDFTYTRPINPYNGTLSLSIGNTNSDVLEDPFDVLEITSEATVGEITFRQPLIETPTETFAVGLVGSRQGTQTFLGIANIGAFPLSAGSNDQGQTAVTAVRFFQEWTRRSTEQVVSLRSQLNFGLEILGATVNDGDVPDSRFFSWLGQGQWVRRLAPDTLLLLKGSVQLTSDSLLSLERYGLGGQANVRGYRQDELLTDNGAALSLEARIPVWRDRDRGGLLQITPFIEGGYGWNNVDANPDNNLLVGVGAGALLQWQDFTGRIDWGVPLISTSETNNTLQEQGIYFSLSYSFF